MSINVIQKFAESYQIKFGRSRRDHLGVAMDPKNFEGAGPALFTLGVTDLIKHAPIPHVLPCLVPNVVAVGQTAWA